MAALSNRDKKTLRIGAMLVAGYLAVFYGAVGFRWLEDNRREYRELLVEAQGLETKRQRQENKALRLEKLSHGADPSGFNRATLVNQVSSAIQKAAQTDGVKVGPIREVPGSAKGKEIAAMQLEAVGPLPGALTLLYRLESMEHPIVVESLQIDPDTRQPGQVKLTLRLVVVDYGRFQPAGGRDV